MALFRKNKEKNVETVEDRRLNALGMTFTSLSNFSKNEALKISTFYGCVNLISNAVAEMPITITKWNGNKKVKVLDGDFWKLLNMKADPKLNHFELFKMAVESVIIKGNAYMEIIRDEQLNVKQLQFIDPDFVQPMLQPNGTVKYSVAGRDRLINDENMINLFLHCDDTYRGISIIRYAYNTLKETYATQEYAGNVYNKSAAGVINSANRLTKEQTQEIYNAWSNAFKNNQSVGVAVLPQGLSFQQLQISARDQDLLASRAFQAEDICRFFGIPASMLNFNEHQSYNSLESDRLNFLQNAILPYVRMFETEFNLKLLKPSQVAKTFIEFDVTELLRVDKKSEADYYKSLLDAGVLSINEVRERLNYEPVDGDVGNALWKQLSFSTVDLISSGQYIKQNAQGQNQDVDNQVKEKEGEN